MRGVLDLFVRCETVLPNLYIGTLTRDTVTSALARGLAADDLISFLESHAHPRAAQRKLAVPEVSLCSSRKLLAPCDMTQSGAGSVYVSSGMESCESHSSQFILTHEVVSRHGVAEPYGSSHLSPQSVTT